ncbi:MAG: ParB N-terminal domain-containing protein [Candidatus Solibacter sp.]
MNTQIEQIDPNAGIIQIPATAPPAEAESETAAHSTVPPLVAAPSETAIEVAPRDEPSAGDAAPELLPLHPLCALFPIMGNTELEKLADNIKTHGLLHPVVTHEGQVVDGRHRQLACKMAGVEPRFVDWRDVYSGSMSLCSWVWSVNGERRHLSVDQIAMIHESLRGWEVAEEARQRQIEAGSQQAERGKEGGRISAEPLAAISPQGGADGSDVPGVETAAAKRDRSRDTRNKLAAEAGVSPYKMQQAKNVSADPELAKEVTEGKSSLRAAEKKVKAKKAAAGLAAPKVRKVKPGHSKKSQCEPFNMERAMKKVMPGVDAVLNNISDEDRTEFLKQLIDLLIRMQ